MTTEFHFAEDAFALHLLFQRLERLVDIVVANENLHVVASPVVGFGNWVPVGMPGNGRAAPQRDRGEVAERKGIVHRGRVLAGFSRPERRTQISGTTRVTW